MNRYISIRTFCVFLWLSLLSSSLWGQQTSIFGIVSLNETDGDPIAQVRIHARGANSVITDSKGAFELVFADKKSGDRIRLHAEKSGLEVVNLEVLKPVIPAGSDETIEIIMCKSGERDRHAHKHYRISIENILDKKYKEDLEKIIKDDKNGLDTDAITRLTQERNQAQEEAEEMAKALAKADLDHVSTTYNMALFYFNKGQREKVLELLSDELLDVELQKAEEIEEKAQETRLQVMQSYILKANAFFQANRVEKAFYYFERAKSVDSVLFHNLIAPGSLGNQSDLKTIPEVNTQDSLDTTPIRASLTFFSGIVRNATTGREIKGVRVTCCGGLEGVTDRKGRFTLSIPPAKRHPTQQAFFEHEKYTYAKRMFLLDGSAFDIFLQPK